MSNSLATQDRAEIVPAQQQENNIGSVIQMALANGYSAEHMRELYAFHREVKADQAREAFYQEFTAFKAEPFIITRDKENKQYSKGDYKAMYTSLENMVATVTPYLSKHGLSASWGILAQTPESITIACTVTHLLGHSRTESITGGPDQSGAKNALQQIKSSMTYLKIATYEAVLGLASEFGNLSDDGNAAGNPYESQICDYEDAINACQNRDELKQIWEKADAFALGIKDLKLRKRFADLKDTKKGAL